MLRGLKARLVDTARGMKNVLTTGWVSLEQILSMFTPSLITIMFLIVCVVTGTYLLS